MTTNPFLEEDEPEDAPVLPPVVDTHEAVQPEAQVLDSQVNRANGLNKCPSCGSSEVQYLISEQMLCCEFCRHKWSEARADALFGEASPVESLEGTVRGTALRDIDEAAGSTVTLKCQGCGAEIVLNVDDAVQARCHWCRQTLSLNTQMPNGAVPDAILPFRITKEDAVKRLHEFAGKRELFAHSKFKKQFKPENVMGVYLPYVVVDGNLTAALVGLGEIQTRRYTRGTGDNKKTYYDADQYRVERSFDLVVDDLTTESSASRADQSGLVNTNNVINAVLPFPVKEAVQYNANYLKGFTSERRDLNLTDMDMRVRDQFLSIARAQAASTILQYRRGVRWEHEAVKIHGTRWVSVYLPIWLYSYVETRGSRQFVHYIAVNATTGECMGSIPVAKAKLLMVSSVLGIAASIVSAFMFWGDTLDTYDGSTSSPPYSDTRYAPNDRFGETP